MIIRLGRLTPGYFRLLQVGQFSSEQENRFYHIIYQRTLKFLFFYSNEEETEHPDEGFSYFWDQDSFDPVSNHAKFYIHFKRRGEARQDRVFSYDWRMWSIPEIRDIMEDVGFREVHSCGLRLVFVHCESKNK